MKKSVVLCIAVIYVASIVVISLFGMKMSVYNEIIPVSSVECKNESKDNIVVINDTVKNVKTIKVKFESAANEATLTGTMIQIETRVHPDNASTKEVKYQYTWTEKSKFRFYKGENGKETGLVLFFGVAIVNVTIISTDGRQVSTDIKLWAY